MKLLNKIYLICLFFPPIVHAQTTQTTASSGLLQILSALVFIIFIMLVAAWALKKITPIHNQHKVNVKVVGGTNIGHREKIMVIEVANQWIIIGVTANRINTLSTMEKIDTTPENQQAINSTTPFSSWLKKTIEQRRNAST